MSQMTITNLRVGSTPQEVITAARALVNITTGSFSSHVTIGGNLSVAIGNTSQEVFIGDVAAAPTSYAAYLLALSSTTGAVRNYHDTGYFDVQAGVTTGFLSRIRVTARSEANAGAILFETGDGVATVVRGRITGGGILAWGTAVTADASAGDSVYANGRGPRGVAGATTIPMITIDSTSRVQIGTGSSLVKIGAASSLDAGLSSRDKSIIIDSANNRFVYYINGDRFYVAGTPF